MGRLEKARFAAVVALFLVVSTQVSAQSASGLHLSDSRDCDLGEEQTRLGESLLDQHNYTSALRQFIAATKLCPGSPKLSVDLTLTYLKLRRFQDAERAAKMIIAQDPGSERGQLMLADSYFMQQKFPEAGRTLQKLLARDPNNADAHKLAGLTLFFYKRYFMAENELRAALRLRPTDKEALYSLGRIYYTQNNFPPAIRVFQRLIVLDPENYKAYNNLALCYEAVRRNDEAEMMFKKAQQLVRKLAPEDDWPYSNMAAMLLKEGRAADALPYLQQALRVNPKSARDFCLTGNALFQTGQVHQAVKDLQQSVKLDPGYAEPHYLLGKAYERLHDTNHAQREFATFQELSERKESPKL